MSFIYFLFSYVTVLVCGIKLVYVYVYGILLSIARTWEESALGDQNMTIIRHFSYTA